MTGRRLEFAAIPAENQGQRPGQDGGMKRGAIALILLVLAESGAFAQTRQLQPPTAAAPQFAPAPLSRPSSEPSLIPPADIPNIPSAPPPPSALPPQPQNVPLPPTQAAPAAPSVSAGQVTLVVAARWGRDLPLLGGGLTWRIFRTRPDASGSFRPVKEDKSASPNFTLPPGDYVVHVSSGLASAVKTVQLRSETVREVLDLPAGGLRLEGKVGDARIPPGQITFDVFQGSQFEPGDRRPIAADVASGDVVMLPEGTYSIASKYGDANALVRSDIRVQVGKLTDVTVNHRAAVITLKLVSDKGGEALANTAWSVVTANGDEIFKNKIDAYHRVVLSEGEYQAVATNEGNVFHRDFKVIAGVDGEVEVLAR